MRVGGARRRLLGERLEHRGDRGSDVGGGRGAAARGGDRVARVADDRVAGAQQQFQLAGVLGVEVARRDPRASADVADARVQQPTLGDERDEGVLDALAMQPGAILRVQRGRPARETLLGWARLGRHLCQMTIRVQPSANGMGRWAVRARFGIGLYPIVTGSGRGRRLAGAGSASAGSS